MTSIINVFVLYRMIRNLKVINAYPEFRTTAGINQVKNAVIAAGPPAGFTPA